ncbi:MAG: Tol biopolymer transport system component [Rhodothermales bacterium]|jgi:Tol biopolymer transport system component
MSLQKGWDDWIKWEKEWQQGNLSLIRQKALTPFRSISERALGSVSRPYFDEDRNEIYMAIRYPGQVAHIASINLETGKLKRLKDVTGPAGFTVTSLAYDRTSRKLFYTTNNRNWRNLLSLDLATGETKTLIKDVRTGDLAFNVSDKSLWGMRHFNGLSTIVRIPEPYAEWQQVYTLPYGLDMFDLDVSPDGNTLIASAADVTGAQQLVSLNIPTLLEGAKEYEVLFDFAPWAPANFVFAPDGKSIFGTSYYTGVSNVYRYDVEEDEMESLSNVESGFFRPTPLSADSLLVFRFTGNGFIPSIIPNQVPDEVSAVRLLGNEIAAKEPVVNSWAVG